MKDREPKFKQYGFDINQVIKIAKSRPNMESAKLNNETQSQTLMQFIEDMQITTGARKVFAQDFFEVFLEYCALVRAKDVPSRKGFGTFATRLFLKEQPDKQRIYFLNQTAAEMRQSIEKKIKEEERKAKKEAKANKKENNNS